MSVRGHEPRVLAGEREQHAVEGIARLVVRDREAGRGEHLAQHLAFEADPVRLRGGDHRREIIRGHADQLVGRRTALEADRRIVLNAQGHVGGRELLDDLGELSRGHRDGALAGDAGGHGNARAHFEIRGGDAHGLAIRLEQHVGEDRQRLTRLHDVLDHLQALEERVTVQDDFHRVTPVFCF